MILSFREISRKPEDDFLLRDFEECTARSDGGWFVRPALRIFAGRNHFSRTTFARFGWLDWRSPASM